MEQELTDAKRKKSKRKKNKINFWVETVLDLWEVAHHW